MPERALEDCSALAPVDGLCVPHFKHCNIVLQIPLVQCPLTDAEYMVVSWVLYSDGVAVAKTGKGGVLLWGTDAQLVIA